MKFFLDILRENENAKILIGFPKVGSAGVRETITAYIAGNLTIGGTAAYSEPGTEVYGDLAQSFNRGLNQVGALTAGMESFGVPSMINRQFKTIQSTIATWTHSEKFIFTLNFRFYAFAKEDDVRVPVRRFLECVYPVFETEVPGLVRAPNEYDFTMKSCLSVRIGKWFRTPPLFIVKNTRWDMSKETITGGNPLFAEGTVTFEAYRMLSAEEVSGFLISGSPPEYIESGTAIT